jgi:hypothetical protein
VRQRQTWRCRPWTGSKVPVLKDDFVHYAFIIIHFYFPLIQSLVYPFITRLLLFLFFYLKMHFSYFITLTASVLLTVLSEASAAPSPRKDSKCHTIAKGYFSAIVDHSKLVSRLLHCLRAHVWGIHRQAGLIWPEQEGPSHVQSWRQAIQSRVPILSQADGPQ